MDPIIQGLFLHRAHIVLHERLDIKADHIAWMFREQCVEIILWLRLVQDLDNIPLTGEKIQVKADIRVSHTADPEAVDIVGTALADLVGDDLGKLGVCRLGRHIDHERAIARVAEDLKKHGAMSYTTIVAATASDSAPLQYIAPYAGTALAEYFMSKGKSVLIVYDDLSKHAVAYRAISLLLRRSPGREAYPGDVFYLHSRLLERSCRMRDDLGGGSITALPIVETQAGDVSAYIPTNVISITDGQIFLESALFNAGNRPAVNVGLSVSRVGGAAQTKAMKKANANLRIELAQYKDMESFAQFSSDLDAETRRQLDHGKALMEMLKQPLYQPKSDAEQVVTLVLASHGVLDELPTAELRAKTSAFVRQFRADVSGTMDKITATGKLEPEMVDAILNAWKAYAGGDSHAVQ